MTNPLTLTVPEGVPFIEFEREFDAPVEAVFRAHQDPDLVKQWLGPRGYRWTSSATTSAPAAATATCTPRRRRGVRLQRRLPRRARERVRHPDLRVRGLPGRGRIESMRFEDLGNGRTRLRATRSTPRTRPATAWSPSGMEGGMREGYERLEELLSGAKV